MRQGTTSGRLTLREVMSSPVVTVGFEATVAEAARLMIAHRVGSVVVLRARQPAGIFTERDLVRFAASGAVAARSLVRAWMTRRLWTAEDDTDCVDAWHAVRERTLRHLPVLRDGRLVGIVSMRDLARLAEVADAGAAPATA